MFRLLVFDLEGTLIENEFLPELAERVGKGEEVWRITKEGVEGKIDWEMGLKKRIAILKGLPMSVVEEESSKIRFVENALDVCKKLKKKGLLIAIISGGFNILADKVASIVSADYVFANRLVFNDGLLEGVELFVTPSGKGYIVERLQKSLGISPEETVVVADGANDIEMFRNAGLKLGFRPQPPVKGVIDRELKNLDEILDLV